MIKNKTLCIILLLIFTFSLLSCSKTEEVPETESEVVEKPVESEYIKFNSNVSDATEDYEQLEEVPTQGYVKVDILNFNNYGKKCTIVSETTEYTAKHNKTIEAIWAAAVNDLDIYIKANRKNVVEAWYAFDKLSQIYVKADSYKGVTNFLQLPGIGATANCFCTVIDTDKDFILIQINGIKYKLYTDTYDPLLFTCGQQYHFDISVDSVNGKPYWLKYTITNCTEIPKEDVTQNTEIEETPVVNMPEGFDLIKPLDYTTESDTGNCKLAIKGEGEYTTNSVEDAEVIYLAYNSEMDIYVKTSTDNLYEIEDYLLTYGMEQLPKMNPEELMMFLNKSHAEPIATNKTESSGKLIAVSDNINVAMGVSDIDSVDERPAYSFHYCVINDKTLGKCVLKYTAGTSGLEYSKLVHTSGSKVKYTYSVIRTETKKTGNIVYNYVLDSIARRKK